MRWPIHVAVATFATLVTSSTASPAATTAAPAPPAEFTASPKTGPGGTAFRDYPHVRIYNAPNASIADASARMLESAYSCFVDNLGWRSTGLSFNQKTDGGPWYKLNVYRVDDLPGAAANTGTDGGTGLSFLNVVTKYLTVPSITVHEFGHALTYAARVWINQTKTGAWWETVAQFVADTFITSDVCRAARTAYAQADDGPTMMDLKKVLGDAFQAIVDGTRSPAKGEPTANYYQAWPLFVYLFYNPDDHAPLRNHAVFPGVWTQYAANSDETPLHVLARILAAPGSTSIQALVGRYWARMAFVDIGHPSAHALYLAQRKSISYAVLDSMAAGHTGAYRVKAARQPRYMGASIVPLKAAGTTVSVNITASAPYTATLVTRRPTASGRSSNCSYTDVLHGTAQITVSAGDELALVVANTPDQLLSYDPFNMPAAANRGLDYQVQLTGATPGGW
ncbi:hypothetical protein HMPREF1624_06900 [Sporothrix schenckii ATCC 58251]|uniref:Uncharacterized protein n=1 Tax=Sporothrix schenckii (strain ATCC 58251 / de Perez 2211183) TaxID=1391915 RepID=U7PP25_SPOS1|nr:hypothetical protein HMPREF1624_06900 [Sporothrix schenckii ATCC 58251]